MLVTKKAAFERLKARIEAGAPRATTDKGGCTYDPRINGGCAIGCFLSVEEFEAALNTNLWVESLFKANPSIAARFEDPDSKFWKDLQGTHDMIAGYNAEGIAALAEEYPEVLASEEESA